MQRKEPEKSPRMTIGLDKQLGYKTETCKGGIFPNWHKVLGRRGEQRKRKEP